MTPLMLRLHEERKARLQRMGSSIPNFPTATNPIPDGPLENGKLEVVNQIPELEPEWIKPPGYDGWFWPAVPVPPEELKVRFIMKVICLHFDIPRYRILSDDRHANIVRARMLISYLARKLTYASFIGIGAILNKDHTTIIHSYHKLAKFADNDIQIMQITQLVKEKWHEDSQDQCESRETRGSEHNGLQRPQLGHEPNTVAVCG